MQINRRQLHSFFLAAGAAGLMYLTACQKYARLDPVPQAAYIRVFNGITTSSTFRPGDTVNQLAPSPWVSILFDPVMDGSGNPMDAKILGDFLGPASDYYKPQQVRPGQKATGAYTSSYNEDYPGVQPVLTAPVQNGLDLSRWAQVPSGRHRVIISFRQVSDAPYPQLLLSYRRPVIVDTTLDFDPGALYTLEVLNRDAGKPASYDLLIRKEILSGYNFSPGKIYVNFFNFSADTTVLPESFDVYSCKYYDSSSIGGDSTPDLTPETYLTAVHKRFALDVAADAPYAAIDATPRDSFLFSNGDYRPLQKRPTIILRLYRTGENAAGNQRPFFSLTCGDSYYAGNAPGMSFNGHGEGMLMGPLEQTITIDNYSSPFVMINTLELRVAASKKINASLITVEHFVNIPGN
jgi:hypothetical protein